MQNPHGKLNEKDKAEAARNHSEREEMPSGSFLDPEARKYPVKAKRDGEWKYDRNLLLAAEREANMHGHPEIADRAKAILEREFGRANDGLAMDESMRSYDADGRLHVARSHISKANICPYYGREIPGCEQLGLDPDKVYQLLRDPEELRKAAPSFAGLPILKEHVSVTADAPRPDLVIGAIGSEVVFDAPYLDADLTFWTAAAIAGIESGQIKELSCAYRYVPVMEPGEYDGNRFDGRMTDIIGNHLAVVEDGRAGSDVVVADRDPFQTLFKERSMKMTRIGKALFAALGVTSKRLAQDGALGAIVGDANSKNLKDPAFRNAMKKRLIALDATLNPQQLDNVIDALLDVEQSPEPKEVKNPIEEGAGDEEDPHERLKKILAGKVDDQTMNDALDCFPKTEAKDGKGATFPPDEGLDEELDEKGRGRREGEDDGKEPMKKKDVDKAMDAFGKKLREQFRDAAEAARDVRPVVGDVIGMDSAAEIYRFALDHMQVNREGVEGTPALRALYRVAVDRKAAVPPIAQDSANLEERFPTVVRFGRA
jgi:hypothetical protein